MSENFEKTGGTNEQPDILREGSFNPEIIKPPEIKFEQTANQAIEKEGQNLDQEKVGESVQSSVKIASKTPSQLREEAIDGILSDGLSDVFIGLPPLKQQEFRVEGEKTVKMISSLIEKGKLSISNLTQLIRKWLLIIPGVNRFFLEQEAKIKAIKIMNITKDR